VERRDFLRFGLGVVAASAAVAVGVREVMAAPAAVQQSPLSPVDAEPAVATGDDIEDFRLQNAQFVIRRRRRRRVFFVRPRRRRVFFVRRRRRRILY
jgi:hypothetical protein